LNANIIADSFRNTQLHVSVGKAYVLAAKPADLDDESFHEYIPWKHKKSSNSRSSGLVPPSGEEPSCWSEILTLTKVAGYSVTSAAAYSKLISFSSHHWVWISSFPDD
jgi:hypothetical protein